MNWTPFDETKGSRQPLPEEHKRVLVTYAPESLGPGLPSATAVGYLKFAAGDKESPNFIVPGIGGKPTHWLDILPDNFGEDRTHPYWRFPHRAFGR